MISKKILNFIPKLFHFFSLILLFLIGLILIFLAFKRFFLGFIDYLNGDITRSALLGEIFSIFLYIEIIAAIRIYFSDNFHFPLRFFFYIGITDLIRFLILNHSDPKLVYSSSIGILIIVFSMILYEWRGKIFGKLKKKELDI